VEAQLVLEESGVHLVVEELQVQLVLQEPTVPLVESQLKGCSGYS
jgi:hypothetical protein